VALLLGWGPAAPLPLPHPPHACFAPPWNPCFVRVLRCSCSPFIYGGS
jgi:hypothetical protein